MRKNEGQPLRPIDAVRSLFESRKKYSGEFSKYAITSAVALGTILPHQVEVYFPQAYVYLSTNLGKEAHGMLHLSLLGLGSACLANVAYRSIKMRFLDYKIGRARAELPYLESEQEKL